MSHHDNKDYAAGKIARLKGHTRYACPHAIKDMHRRSWWLAGWHDKDIELENKQ